MSKPALYPAGFIIAAMALGGCAGGTAGTSAPGSFSPSLRPATHSLSFAPDARGLQKVVYVADVSKVVPFFTADIHAKNPQALGSITVGVTRADGLWVDKNGTLYLSNLTWPPSIAEYKRGQSAPFKIITNGLYTPAMLAVDSSGNLYVADGSNILVYPPGASSPSRSIPVPKRESHSVPGGLAFDNKGNLLVATFDVEHQVSDLYSIAPGSSQAQNLNFQGLAGSALGADKAGNIYDGGQDGNISVYAPGTTSPSRYMNAGNEGGFYSDFNVTSNGTLYWPNYNSGEMYEFAPGASGPTNVFYGGGGVDAAVGPR